MYAKRRTCSSSGSATLWRASMITTIPLTLLLGMACPGTLAADPLFGAKTDFGTGSYPWSVAIGDLNGDGKPDLVTANDGTVSVLLGNGDGTFGAKTDFGTGSCPNTVAIADLNGDGKPDLATANYCDNTVSVLLGNGDGTFGAKTDFGTRRHPISVAIADLNGDGKPDLVTANYHDGDDSSVSVLLGNGDGTFGAKTDFGTGHFLGSMAIGDLNGDGKPDLVTTNSCICDPIPFSSLSVLLGNGDGTFGAKTDIGTGDFPALVAIADLNADSKPDLVTVSFHSGGSVLLGNGDGTFGASTGFGTGNSPGSVAIADLNGDGKPDLATANISDNTVSVLLGNGDGTFGAHSDFGTGPQPFSVAIGDLNGDGKPDLATANFGSNTVSVLLNIGPPSCPAASMSFDLTPNTLNLRSMGHWVTGVLEPEPPASPADIDVASIRLNGTVPVDASAPTSIGDVDSDGRPDLTVKFDRAAVELVVQEGEAVTAQITGRMRSGECFQGSDIIRVRRGHVLAPAAGTVLAGGSVFEVRWSTPAGVQVQSVSVLSSIDDGANWTLAAQGLPDTGSYLWTVPQTATEQARVAVVLVESADETGYNVDGVLGTSERFVIAFPVSVSDATASFALYGVVPNPSRGLNVSFSLTKAEPATLTLFDVRGRKLSVRQVGSLGGGRHVITLEAPGKLAPGIYLVRLVQGDQQLTTRAVVIE